VRHRSLLARHPGLALSFAAAAFVTTLPAAAAAPFVSAVRSATLQHSIDRACPWDLGATQHIANPDRAAFEQAAAPHPVERLGPAVRTMSTELTAHTNTRPQQPTRLTLLARDGFADHVTVRSGPAGRGLWLPAAYADANGLAVGDSVTLAGTSTMTVQVAAVYTGLQDPYWCSYRDRAEPVVLVDWEDMLALSALQPDRSELAVEHAVLDADRLTQPEAVATARRIAASDARSTLMEEAERADATRRAILGSIVPLTVAGVLAGLAVLATSTRRWSRRSLPLLRGSSGENRPGTRYFPEVVASGQFAAEVFPALAAGVFAGAVTAYGLVRVFGPSRLLSAEAAPLTLVGAGCVLLAAVAVTGVARFFPRLRYWELLPLATAYPVWRATHALVLVPLLVAAGLAGILTGLGRRALAGTREGRNSAGSLLAWRRLSSQARPWAILAVAIALPTALVAYGDAALASGPVRYAFGYLAGLGLLTAVIVVVMLLWYVESRVTERRRAFTLLRRMGLRRRTHLRATAVELGVPLFAGLLGGLALAAALARLLAGVPLRPGPVAIIAALVTAIAAGAAGYAHCRAAR
jgi:putative ABC transport system permease protein